MKIVTRYQCEKCGQLFVSEELCNTHEQRHLAVENANSMLKNGSTLKDINDACHIWNSLPEHLENVTKDNCFKISYWQCCNKPAYTITYICMDGKLHLHGCGSWTGYYGNKVNISSSDLLHPYSKEELFVYRKFL